MKGAAIRPNAGEGPIELRRRELLAGGLVAAFIGGPALAASETPRKGGVLRLGLAGGWTSDTLDPGAFADTVTVVVARALYGVLVEAGPDGRPKPGLAASFEAKNGARDWIFNLRKGIKFTNGREFTATDAIFSLNARRGSDFPSACRTLASVVEIKKIDKYQIAISLAAPDADFPIGLDDPRLPMVPDGFTDWRRPVGTGAFRLERFDPGERVVLKRNPDYAREGRGHLDGAEILVLNDPISRLEALRAGQVDVVNRVDSRVAAAIDNGSQFKLVRATSSRHFVAAMQVDKAPFDNADFRLALKYALDRDQMVKTLYAGYGAIGADHPIAPNNLYFNTEMGSQRRDPERAAYHLKKSGRADAKIVLNVSELVAPGAVTFAQAVQMGAASIGVRADVVTALEAGYWDTTWLKQPFVVGHWRGCSGVTEMLAMAYAAGAPFNETHWSDDKFEKLLADARGEVDEAKRKPYLWEMQRLLREEGGALIPVFADWLDARHERVGGFAPHAGFELDNGQILEKAFLKS